MNTYQSYRNLPPLAGLCSMGEAMNPGLSVEECVRRLKRYHYAFKRLHEILTARITSEPIYELKMGFSLHAHLCAEHTDGLRKRIGEMREPPLGLEVVPNANLKVFFVKFWRRPRPKNCCLVSMRRQCLRSSRHWSNTNVTQTNWLTNPRFGSADSHCWNWAICSNSAGRALRRWSVRNNAWSLMIGSRCWTNAWLQQAH